jgi:hypothetical protein
MSPVNVGDPISQERLNVWIYMFLLGTLSPQKTEILKEELERRHRENQLSSAIEMKLLAAFIVDRPTRRYLAKLLADWEKRNWGD